MSQRPKSLFGFGNRLKPTEDTSSSHHSSASLPTAELPSSPSGSAHTFTLPQPESLPPPYTDDKAASSALTFTPKRTFCVCLDDGVASKYALSWAMENLFKMEEDLVVVLNLRPGTLSPNDPNFVDFGDYLSIQDSQEQEMSHTLLNSISAKLISLGFHVRALALRGERPHELIKNINKLAPVAVVMGNNNKASTGMKKFFSSSTVETLQKELTIPVIAVKYVTGPGAVTML